MECQSFTYREDLQKGQFEMIQTVPLFVCINGRESPLSPILDFGILIEALYTRFENAMIRGPLFRDCLSWGLVAAIVQRLG